MEGLINLKNRAIDEQGNVVYFSESLVDMLYNGEIPSEILYPYEDKDIELFNKYSYERFDDIYYSLPNKLKTIEERKNNWFYPEKYDQINLEEYFLNLCYNDIERNRVKEELEIYLKKDMDKFLRCCIFLSDKIKENNWVVGCGRGSSVSSYILFKLKIHLIDSIKYGLDIKEFLKD